MSGSSSNDTCHHEGVGLEVEGLGFATVSEHCSVSGFGFRVPGFEFRVLGLRYISLGFRVWGLGFRVWVWGSGFRV